MNRQEIEILLDVFGIPTDRLGVALEFAKPTELGNGQYYPYMSNPNSYDTYVYNPDDKLWYSKTPEFNPDSSTTGRPIGTTWQYWYPANKEHQDYLNKGRQVLIDRTNTNRTKISPKTNTPYTDSQKFQPRRDPLTFDLDGDGLETTGISATNPILFDHDGDGTKNATGWIKPDDAFLVRDINNNGSIDSGRELFGDSTLLTSGPRAGQKAIDGFDALADLDSNADGTVNSSDSAYASLKLWRDLNQDGISQTNELFTLASQNIIGIKVAKTANSQVLANGNQLADTGSFIKSDGSTGTVGEITGNLGDINLAGNTFYREFPNQLDTTSVNTLPDMQGSGAIRDLREAATQSTTLKTLLSQYSAATTRAAQMALLDQLLDAWADTSGYKDSLDDRVAAMPNLQLTMAGTTYSIPYYVRYEAFGDVKRTYVPTTSTVSTGSSGGGTVSISGEGPGLFDRDNTKLTDAFRQTAKAWDSKIHILEAFNGNYFFGLPATTQTLGASTGMTIKAADPNDIVYAKNDGDYYEDGRMLD